MNLPPSRRRSSSTISVDDALEHAALRRLSLRDAALPVLPEPDEHIKVGGHLTPSNLQRDVSGEDSTGDDVRALTGPNHPELARVAHDRRVLMQRLLLRDQLPMLRCSELTRLVSCAAWAAGRDQRETRLQADPADQHDHDKHHEAELAVPADLGDREAMR